MEDLIIKINYNVSKWMAYYQQKMALFVLLLLNFCILLKRLYLHVLIFKTNSRIQFIPNIFIQTCKNVRI